MTNDTTENDEKPRKNHGIFRRALTYLGYAAWARDEQSMRFLNSFNLVNFSLKAISALSAGHLVLAAFNLPLAGVFAVFNFASSSKTLKAYRDAHHPKFADRGFRDFLRKKGGRRGEDRASYGLAEHGMALLSVPAAMVVGGLVAAFAPVVVTAAAGVALAAGVGYCVTKARQEDAKLLLEYNGLKFSESKETTARRAGVVLAMPKVEKGFAPVAAPTVAVQAKGRTMAANASRPSPSSVQNDKPKVG